MLILLVETISGSRLINGQSNLIETGYFHNSSTFIAMHVIVGKIGYDLSQYDNVSVASRILGEIIFENCYLLVRRRLSSFCVQCWSIFISRKQIVMDEGT